MAGSSSDGGGLSLAAVGGELSRCVVVEAVSVPFGSLGADEPSGASLSIAEAPAAVADSLPNLNHDFSGMT